MELYDDAGLLRALATSPERRGDGLGWMLADAALGRARSRGCRRVYLITENASDFFAEKFGFRAVQPSSWSTPPSLESIAVPLGDAERDRDGARPADRR